MGPPSSMIECKQATFTSVIISRLGHRTWTDYSGRWCTWFELPWLHWFVPGCFSNTSRADPLITYVRVHQTRIWWLLFLVYCIQCENGLSMNINLGIGIAYVWMFDWWCGSLFKEKLWWAVTLSRLSCVFVYANYSPHKFVTKTFFSLHFCVIRILSCWIDII